MKNRYFLILILIVVISAGYWVADSRLNLFSRPVDKGERINFSQEQKSAENPLVLEDYEVREVVSGLEIPWDIAFTSASRMLVTERHGRVRVVENGVLQSEPIKVFDEVSIDGEEGLMSAELDPEYDKNGYIYFSLAYGADGSEFVKVVRFTDEGKSLSDEFVVIDKIPAARYHAGSRLAFGPPTACASGQADCKLYITTGDATNGDLAQDLDSLAGKILRINKDGSIPDDNPFAGSPIWSWGHRNPQGIDWTSLGEMYSSEHGPSGFDGPGGGDEVNRIVKGTNYGWPLVSHEKSIPEAKDPLVTFTPAEAPGSLLVYKGDALQGWQGDVFFGALRGEGIMRLVFDKDNPDKLRSYEKLDKVDFGRIRTVVQGIDGNIYFTTSNRDGRGDPARNDDRIFVIKPVK